MSSILLVLPVPFRRKNGDLQIESQAWNVLDKWSENFGPNHGRLPSHARRIRETGKVNRVEIDT